MLRLQLFGRKLLRESVSVFSTLQLNPMNFIFCIFFQKISSLFQDCYVADEHLNPLAKDEELQNALWEKSDEFVGKFEDENQIQRCIWWFHNIFELIKLLGADEFLHRVCIIGEFNTKKDIFLLRLAWIKVKIRKEIKILLHNLPIYKAFILFFSLFQMFLFLLQQFFSRYKISVLAIKNNGVKQLLTLRNKVRRVLLMKKYFKSYKSLDYPD